MRARRKRSSDKPYETANADARGHNVDPHGPSLSRLGCWFVSLMLSASKATLSLPSFLSAEDKGMGYGALEELSVRNSLATASAAGVVRVRELTFLFLHSVSPWPCSDVASSVVEAVQVGTPPGAPFARP